MKKVLFIMTLCAFTNVLFASNRMQIVVNYSNGLYRGFTYDKIVEVEPDFIKDKPRYEGKFMRYFIETYCGAAYLTATPNSEEDMLTIEIINVSHKGNLQAEVSYKDQKIIFNSKGGTFGTFLNLFGDGMGHLGKDLAIWLNNLSISK